MAGEQWRVGRKVGRTIYRQQSGTGPSDDDELVGLMDTRELAQQMVEALNAMRGNFEVGDRLPVFRDGAPTEIEAVVTRNEDGLVQIDTPPLMEPGRYTIGGRSA